jgi:hypothetical protein
MKGLDKYCWFLFIIENYVIDFNTTKVIIWAVANGLQLYKAVIEIATMGPHRSKF